MLLSKGRGRIRVDTQDHSFRSAADYARHPWIEDMLTKANEPQDLGVDAVLK
jgi:hypothetical protein